MDFSQYHSHHFQFSLQAYDGFPTLSIELVGDSFTIAMITHFDYARKIQYSDLIRREKHPDKVLYLNLCCFC